MWHWDCILRLMVKTAAGWTVSDQEEDSQAQVEELAANDPFFAELPEFKACTMKQLALDNTVGFDAAAASSGLSTRLAIIATSCVPMEGMCVCVLVFVHPCVCRWLVVTLAVCPQ